MRIIWWTLLATFVVATGITVTHRITGYTNASTDGSHYFAFYRSTRYEVSQQEYERVKYQDPLSFYSGIAMILSACGLGGLEALRQRSGDRALTSRRNGPARRNGPR